MCKKVHQPFLTRSYLAWQGFVMWPDLNLLIRWLLMQPFEFGISAWSSFHLIDTDVYLNMKKKKNQGKANSVSEAGGAAEKLVSFQLWYRCTFKVTLKPFSPRARLKASAGGFEWIIIIIIFSFWLVVVWLIVHDCFLLFFFVRRGCHGSNVCQLLSPQYLLNYIFSH